MLQVDNFESNKKLATSSLQQLLVSGVWNQWQTYLLAVMSHSPVMSHRGQGCDIGCCRAVRMLTGLRRVAEL